VLAPEGRTFRIIKILTTAPNDDELVFAQELEKDDRCTRVALRYHISPPEHNWCVSMLTLPVAMLCRVRSAEKTRNMEGGLAASTPFIRERALRSGWCGGAEEAMLGSLKYIPPVLCRVHTAARPSFTFCLSFSR
jgi:hypothetical protein